MLMLIDLINDIEIDFMLEQFLFFLQQSVVVDDLKIDSTEQSLHLMTTLP